jgi:hypothetical protein
MSEIICTVHKNPSCYFENIDDYKRVRCSKDIKAGDILLIEHCYYQSVRPLQTTVQWNEKLYNSLYPRQFQWSYDFISRNSTNSTKIIRSKVKNNCFGYDDKYLIGKDVSWFNHSKFPNAIVGFLPFETSIGINCVFIYVYATTNMNHGDEIYIKYNDTISFGLEHKHMYKNEVDGSMLENIKRIVEMEILQYFKTDIFRHVYFNQINQYNGYFLLEDKIGEPNLNISPTFIEYIKELYGSYNEDIANKWRSELYDKIMNFDFNFPRSYIPWNCINVNHIDDQLCSTCNMSPSALRQCSKCHRAQYCCTDCQSKGWRNHKLICDDINPILKSISSYESFEEMHSLNLMYTNLLCRMDDDNLINICRPEYIVKNEEQSDDSETLFKTYGSLKITSKSLKIKSGIYDIKHMNSRNVQLASTYQSGCSIANIIPFWFSLNVKDRKMNGEMFSMGFLFYRMMYRRYENLESIYHNVTFTFDTKIINHNNSRYHIGMTKESISDFLREDSIHNILGFTGFRKVLRAKF